MSPSFSPGHDLAGRYRIRELLGVGQTAEVYAADDLSLNRVIVVKLLLPHLAEHEEVRRAFRDNIVRAATLSHPHLARVYDGGQESGHIFMITEYLSGGSLEDVLQSGRTLSVDDSARLGRDVSSALSYVHANGFVHGGLAPAKLLFDDEGRVRVSDIALAGLVDAYRERFTLEDVRYLSPEQAVGDLPTAKSDVYALALILFESVTGTSAFDGVTPEALLRARINANLPVRSDLGTLDMLLAQAAIADPRYRLDAEMFANRLGSVVSDSAPLVVLPVVPDTAVLSQFTPQAPRETIGFNAPSADQITGATRAVPTVAKSFPQPQPARSQGPAPIAAPVEGFEVSSRRTRSERADFERMAPTGRRRAAFFVASLLLVVLAVGGGAAWKLGLFTQKHTVPSLVGLSYKQAATLVKGDGFTITTSQQAPSSSVPANDIVSQTPSPGTTAKSGLVISVVVSSGQALVTLPTSLVGEDCVSATAQLLKLGLTAQCPSSAATASATVPAGRIAKVLYNSTANPLAVPAGSTVVLALSTGAPAGAATSTTTTLVVTGTKPRAVPNLVGLSYSQVVTALKNAGLFYSTSGPGAGTTTWTSVTAQVPVAGTVVKYHSSVRLTVTKSATTASTTTTTTIAVGAHVVPNLVGLSYSQVIAALKSAGYFFHTTGPGAGTTTWTSVTAQSPAAGTTLAPKHTIDLTVTKSLVATTTTSKTTTTTKATTTTVKAAATIAVPNVVGLGYAATVSAMHQAGLYFSTSGPLAHTTKWTKVVSESPAPGMLIKPKGTVFLKVQ